VVADGKHLALGYADESVQVRNATTGSILYTVQSQMGHIWAMAWSPDGKHIASVNDQLRVWQAR
jgi:tricorn protease-like protein